MKKKWRILIADDEPLIRMDLKEMLESEGHEVVAQAVDGEQALNFAKEHQPDLAILDIQMPKTNGLEAAKEIQEAMKIPVLLLTAYSQDKFVDQAAQLGLHGYLVKPIREEQLFPALTIAMKRFEDYQNLVKEIAEVDDKLKKRSEIDKAKSLLQSKFGYSEEEAYQRLRQYSMEKRLTLSEVAAAVLNAVEKLSEK